MSKLKIKDLKVGDSTTIALVVTSATARETKAKKPYLQLELYDGTDKIQGNYWDWTSGKIPEKNTILNVTAQVSEYMGAMQLNIKSMSTNTEMHLSEFTPNSGINVADVYKEAYALASDIKDIYLREVSITVLEQLSDKWLSIPGAKFVHHAYVGGTLVHSLSVAKIAKAISLNIPESNTDLCFVGGLLHDVGKLFTYKMNGITIDMTDNGMLYDHIYMGAVFIDNLTENMSIDDDAIMYKAQILKHIILSHHGTLEFGAVVPPMCIEAHIVYCADTIDAASQQILEQSKKLGDVKWTDKVWGLGNRPQLTTQYVRDIFLPEDYPPFT